jgi:hypothetical protein
MTRDERALFRSGFAGYPVAVNALVARGVDVERSRVWNAIALGWAATDHRTPSLPYFTHGDDSVARDLLRRVLEPLAHAGMRTDDRDSVDARLLEVLDRVRHNLEARPS